MPTQKEHLESLHPNFVRIAQALHENNAEDARKYLIKLGESIKGLDIRLLNDDLSARITEGSDRAIAMLAAKNSPKTQNNRNATNSVDGVLIRNETIENLFQSISFYESSAVEGHGATVLFHNCLDMLAKMFIHATPEENDVLKALAERVMMDE